MNNSITHERKTTIWNLKASEAGCVGSLARIALRSLNNDGMLGPNP